MATHFPTTNRKARPGDPLFEQAFEVTSQILAMVRQRAGERPVLSFSACGHDGAPVNRRLADISGDNGIDYIVGVPDAVRAAKQAGVVVDGSPRDLHWNGTGNAIAGRVLVGELVRRGLVQPVDNRNRDISAESPVGRSD